MKFLKAIIFVMLILTITACGKNEEVAKDKVVLEEDALGEKLAGITEDFIKQLYSYNQERLVELTTGNLNAEIKKGELSEMADMILESSGEPEYNGEKNLFETTTMVYDTVRTSKQPSVRRYITLEFEKEKFDYKVKSIQWGK